MTYLSLYSSTVTDQQLEQLSQAPPLLEILDLSGCAFISDAAIQAVLKNCPHMKMIRLGFVEKLSGDSVETIRTLITDALIKEIMDRGIDIEK